MSYVRRLQDITESDIAQVGGKNANLAKLIQANLPVPDGLAVGLDAFDANGHLRSAAKQLISQYVKPDRLYAVRSSALAEDAEGASWAGQFETFLNTKPEDIITKVEECHNSAKSRAKAYANEQAEHDQFEVAVAVQEMLKPEYAGVLFTKDPVSGKDQLVTEYVSGMGEELVSGRADPKKLILNSTDAEQVPFDTAQLSELAIKTEQLFGVPQDIEWVWAGGKMWLVQARPITTTQKVRQGYYLGEPDELFYWGPSHAEPIYMSDFMAAAERLFIEMATNPEMPNPPKTVVLFYDGKMVWLNNAQDFADFTEHTFEAYEKRNQLETDIAEWRAASEELQEINASEVAEKLIEAWYHTEFAEFSLYGAEASLTKRLSRFDSQTRQEIWSAFTVPDKPTFLAHIDTELVATRDPAAMAEKYPWIQDGYHGVSGKATEYFKQRLKVIGKDTQKLQDLKARRSALAQKLNLDESELNALTLTRQLAEFMDDRKAWMMQTRHLLTKSINNIESGWYFKDGKSAVIGAEDTQELWQRYVDFKSSTSAVVGIVASNGGRHFVNGEVVVVSNPTDSVKDGKIVVVPSTSPSYVPLMRRAKALVTDHGGMMSHAAIVAREFNLPCIVGTQQATKVLHTGDRVVLDLVKGEVNKKK